jgi:hypothetical protein
MKGTGFSPYMSALNPPGFSPRGEFLRCPAFPQRLKPKVNYTPERTG